MKTLRELFSFWFKAAKQAGIAFWIVWGAISLVLPTLLYFIVTYTGLKNSPSLNWSVGYQNELVIGIAFVIATIVFFVWAPFSLNRKTEQERDQARNRIAQIEDEQRKRAEEPFICAPVTEEEEILLAGQKLIDEGTRMRADCEKESCPLTIDEKEDWDTRADAYMEKHRTIYERDVLFKRQIPEPVNGQALPRPQRYWYYDIHAKLFRLTTIVNRLQGKETSKVGAFRAELI